MGFYNGHGIVTVPEPIPNEGDSKRTGIGLFEAETDIEAIVRRSVEP